MPLDHKETLVNLDLLVQPDLSEQLDLKVSKLVSCVCHTNKVMLKIIVNLFTFCFWSFEGKLMHKVGSGIRHATLIIFVLISGPAGSSGPSGSKGQKGDSGVQGSPGRLGATGPAGAPGNPGASGPAGATGQKGQRGNDGSQGQKGEQGVQGSSGPAGELFVYN